MGPGPRGSDQVALVVGALEAHAAGLELEGQVVAERAVEPQVRVRVGAEARDQLPHLPHAATKQASQYKTSAARTMSGAEMLMAHARDHALRVGERAARNEAQGRRSSLSVDTG
eukprot:271438-Rhodomonas_salina.1